jgi:hypothetical protein
MTLFQLHKLTGIEWHEIIITKPWKFYQAENILIYFRGLSDYKHTQYAENPGSKLSDTSLTYHSKISNWEHFRSF